MGNLGCLNEEWPIFRMLVKVLIFVVIFRLLVKVLIIVVIFRMLDRRMAIFRLPGQTMNILLASKKKINESISYVLTMWNTV